MIVTTIIYISIYALICVWYDTPRNVLYINWNTISVRLYSETNPSYMLAGKIFWNESGYDYYPTNYMWVINVVLRITTGDLWQPEKSSPYQAVGIDSQLESGDRRVCIREESL